MMQRREFLGHLVRTTVAGGAALLSSGRAGALAAPQAGSQVAAKTNALSAAPGTSRRASVADFGADATGQTDATAAVQQAIASLTRRNARLVFPAGKYLFAASNAIAMEFRGYDGLEIFGNGAELSFAGGTQPLRIADCRDLEIHDIVVDWRRPPFSEGVVRAVSDRSVTVAIDPAFPIDGSERVAALVGFDGSSKSPMPTGLVIDQGIGMARMSGPQMLEIELAQRSPLTAGMRVALVHAAPSAGEAAAVRMEGCEQVLLETVVLHAVPGTAVSLANCGDITLDTVRVRPRTGGGLLLSSCGDGVEMLDCTGAVAIQHAEIAGTVGAALRIQQSYWRLMDSTDPQVATVASGSGKPVPSWALPKPGAYLQLSEASTLKLLGEIVVTQAETSPAGMKLTFAETLSPRVVKGTLLCLSATDQPRLKMDDSKFMGGPNTGIVVQSRARIANSSFIGYAGPAILLAPDLEHMRGPVVESVHINDCSFERCESFGEATQRGAITRGAITIDTAARPGTSATLGARVNDGITLQRNTFRKLGGPAISCAGTTWLDVESNHFNDCDLLRPAGAVPRAMVLRNLDESTITLNDARADASIVMIDCTDKVKAGDNGTLTVVKG